MNMDKIGQAMLMLYDELKNDKQSKKLIKKMDTATSDAVLKKGFAEGIKRLRELGKPALANDLEEKIKGW
jgi:hypothetical protein